MLENEYQISCYAPSLDQLSGCIPYESVACLVEYHHNRQMVTRKPIEFMKEYHLDEKNEKGFIQMELGNFRVQGSYHHRCWNVIGYAWKMRRYVYEALGNQSDDQAIIEIQLKIWNDVVIAIEL